jgi:PAS domain S-box-containing protein
MSEDHEFNIGKSTSRIRQLSRYLSERSPLPMVAVEGTTHVVTYLNPAFARLAGRQRGDVIGRPFSEAVPEDDGNGCAAMLDRVFRTGSPENLIEQEHHHTQPSSRPLLSCWV